MNCDKTGAAEVTRSVLRLPDQRPQKGFGVVLFSQEEPIDTPVQDWPYTHVRYDQNCRIALLRRFD